MLSASKGQWRCMPHESIYIKAAEMLKAESFEGSARFCKPIGGKLCNGMCSLWGLWAAVLGQSGGTGLHSQHRIAVYSIHKYISIEIHSEDSVKFRQNQSLFKTRTLDPHLHTLWEQLTSAKIGLWSVHTLCTLKRTRHESWSLLPNCLVHEVRSRCYCFRHSNWHKQACRRMPKNIKKSLT